MNSPWFANFSGARRTQLRLFCFPYAGGNAHIFRAWAERLSPSIEIVGVQAPGKGNRALEQPYESVAALTAALSAQIEPLLYDKPFAFFGHSNGALVSFELACQLQTRRLPLPRHLFLSASPAPWTRTFERPYSAMSDEEFKATLQDLNGTPPEILHNRELLDLFLPGLRADFMLAEDYAYAHEQRLSVPTSVYYGEHDEIEEHQVLAWQEQIAPPIRCTRLDGGHFFIHSHLERLTALVDAELREIDAPRRRLTEAYA